MKKIQKLQFQLIKRHLARFLAASAIIVISIGLVTGIGSATNRSVDVANAYYEEQNVSDLVIKTSNTAGFNDEEIAKIEEHFGKDHVSKQTFIELEMNTKRYQYLDLNNNNINVFTLKEGNFPKTSNEILAERETVYIEKHNVGDVVFIMGKLYKISGIVTNPYYFRREAEPLLRDPSKTVTGIFYFNLDSSFPINDIYVTTNYRKINGMDDEYKTHMEVEKNWVLENIKNTSVLTLQECPSFAYLYAAADKVATISWIALAAFMIVAGLVILTIISRLIEEERATAATLKTLGYRDERIGNQYLIFTILALLLGIGLAWPVGYAVNQLIFVNFQSTFDLPNIPVAYNNLFFIITSAVITGVAVLTSIIASIHALKEKPASMLNKKAPKKGKRILLERIPKLWNKMSFKSKCIAKNLLRNKKHLFLTLFSVIGSTVLIFVAAGLLSYTFVDDSKGASIKVIAIVIQIFALALTGVVIYVLTNINISERKREIATFMVLGYYDKEVQAYIFKEIFILAIISAVIGTPLGVLALKLIFDKLNFGGLETVQFWVYIVTPALVLLFTFLVCLLLRKNISKVDMNESLKCNE